MIYLGNNFLQEINKRVLVYDGSKGTMLHKSGLKGGECPELWNVTHKDEVRNVYRSYKEAGSDVIQTNTFQGSRMKLEEYSLGDRTYELNYNSVKLAKEVMGNDGFVAASIGPLGRLFEPSGDLTFDMAHEAFKEQVKAVVEAGVDVINFETFTDVAEMRAALLAAKDVSDIPVICSVAFEANGRTLMGTDPMVAAVVLKSLGADIVGTNCSLGPEQLLEIIKAMYKVCDIPLCVKPNAGLPQVINGETVFKESPDKFSRLAGEYVKYGVRLMGGCCGTTPEFIKAIKTGIEGAKPTEHPGRSFGDLITSSVKLVEVRKLKDMNLGHINTGIDETLLNELSAGNMEAVIDKTIELASEGYDAICVNVDRNNSNLDLLKDVVNTAQGFMREPMIIETASEEALDRALRVYKGKAGVIINADTDDKYNALCLIAKKYGSTIMA